MDLNGKASQAHLSSPRAGLDGCPRRSGGLQVNLEHLELDGQRWLRNECLQNAFGRVGEYWPKAPDKPLANAIHNLEVVVPALRGSEGNGP